MFCGSTGSHPHNTDIKLCGQKYYDIRFCGPVLEYWCAFKRVITIWRHILCISEYPHMSNSNIITAPQNLKCQSGKNVYSYLEHFIKIIYIYYMTSSCSSDLCNKPKAKACINTQYLHLCRFKTCCVSMKMSSKYFLLYNVCLVYAVLLVNGSAVCTHWCNVK